MSWQVQRDGFTAAWIDPPQVGDYVRTAFVRVTGPAIKSPGMEFAIPADCVMDGCDYMHACITYARAALGGQPVRQAIGRMKGART